jgi:hypothetical protein
MSTLAAYLLRLLHLAYAVYLIVYSHWKRLTWRRSLTRLRIPKHLAILLVANSNVELEGALLQSVINAVAWCYSAGIEKLTIYEEHGEP